jgi:hypothetical protein
MNTAYRRAVDHHLPIPRNGSHRCNGLGLRQIQLDRKHSVTVSLNQGSGRIQTANCGVDPGGPMVEKSLDYRLADAPVRSRDQRCLVFDVEYYFQFHCSPGDREGLNRGIPAWLILFYPLPYPVRLSGMSFHYILKNRVI